jgi:hypothetical protein
MKKSKLLVEHSYDFELIGLVSHVRDYKMAWIVNKELDLNLVKFDDIELDFITPPNLIIAHYFLSLPHGRIQLLKNRALNSTNQILYLIPELKSMDYFLLVHDRSFQISINTFATQLNKNTLIQNAMTLDVNKLKSKENLLTH